VLAVVGWGFVGLVSLEPPPHHRASWERGTKLKNDKRNRS